MSYPRVGENSSKMNRSFDNFTSLLDRCKQGEEQALRSLVALYQQRIFALVFYLLGGNEDKTYEVTASSFVVAIQAIPSLDRGETFFTNLTRLAIEKCRDIKVMPSPHSGPDFSGLSPERKETLLIVREALQTLPFDARAQLLLRDQLNARYDEMTSILQLPSGTARSRTIEARSKLRDKIREILAHGK